MRVALIEDELPALEHLELLLGRLLPQLQVCARLRTVRETRAFLREGPPVDLLVADIQLGDGLSLDALAAHPVDLPVIFTTAYDHHLAPALAGNGIAYLLKPIREAELAQALAKLRRLERHFLGGEGPLAPVAAPPALERLVGRRGGDWAGLELEAVAWFTVRNGIVWAVDQAGQELMIDPSLSQLEARLDPRGWFRVSRWFLVRLSAVTRVRAEGRGRLSLTLAPPSAEPVLVSQESAPAFRAWFGIGGAG